MELVTPGLGLLVWMTVVFILLLIILRVFAWKPILQSINKRNQSIEDALKSADNARAEMEKLSANNKKIVAEAVAERDRMLKEAREYGDKIIEDAKNDAKQEIVTLKESAKQEIEADKISALDDIKNQVAEISICIAEKVIRKNLKEDKNQEELVNTMLKDINLN